MNTMHSLALVGARNADPSARLVRQDFEEATRAASGGLPGAACRGADPELFFCSSEDAAERQFAERRAKQICAGCPVRDACLAGALERRERFGIWAGLTTQERRRLMSAESKQRAQAKAAGR
ncbi:WhiB family transcriptional regulator [Kitasatospora kifunensis]|uniref:Transcriptional regulator WhiB n=1 Tax=Kitasatospora kifunensis TaxID=58351 RepID=A0A7W7R3Q2_KITKI|nr:WhiB family transcriptional regulator [Kitasatospora kifunensis]MBB4924774.1 WhiB family redox-sensing transcriptional regulator [Kitasatospora kifunensis]